MSDVEGNPAGTARALSVNVGGVREFEYHGRSARRPRSEP